MCYKNFSTGSDDVQKQDIKQNPKLFQSLTVIVTPQNSITKNSCEKYTEKFGAFTIFLLVQRFGIGQQAKILLH